ncbi:MAG: hypothetical protein ACRCUQ_02535 [Alphaproteobacteria bacterium]
MHYGIRLLMGITLTWMMVVWPPIHQDLSFFGFPLEGGAALSEIEMQMEKAGGEHSVDTQKSEETQPPPEKSKPLEQGKECDPKRTPWWMAPHLPF